MKNFTLYYYTKFKQLEMEPPKDSNFVGMNGEVDSLLIQTTGLGFANRDTEAKKE